jgi:hypothetical protein
MDSAAGKKEEAKALRGGASAIFWKKTERGGDEGLVGEEEEGGKDELTFLQPLLGLGSIMSLIRRFRDPRLSPPPLLFPALFLRLSFPTISFSLLQLARAKVAAIQLTAHPCRHRDASLGRSCLLNLLTPDNIRYEGMFRKCYALIPVVHSRISLDMIKILGK